MSGDFGLKRASTSSATISVAPIGGGIGPLDDAVRAFDGGFPGELIKREAGLPLDAPEAVAVVALLGVFPGVWFGVRFGMIFEQHAAGAFDDEELVGEVGADVGAFDVGAAGDGAVGGGLGGIDPGVALQGD